MNNSTKLSILLIAALLAGQASSQDSLENPDLAVEPALLQSVQDAIVANPEIFNESGKIIDSENFSKVMMMDSALTIRGALKDTQSIEDLERLAEKLNEKSCVTCVPRDPTIPTVPFDDTETGGKCYWDTDANIIVCPPTDGD